MSARHVGVVVLVDGDAGGGVRHVQMADAVLHAGVVHQLRNGRGDVEQLGAALGLHGQFAAGGMRAPACLSCSCVHKPVPNHSPRNDAGRRAAALQSLLLTTWPGVQLSAAADVAP